MNINGFSQLKDLWIIGEFINSTKIEISKPPPTKHDGKTYQIIGTRDIKAWRIEYDNDPGFESYGADILGLKLGTDHPLPGAIYQLLAEKLEKQKFDRQWANMTENEREEYEEENGLDCDTQNEIAAKRQTFEAKLTQLAEKTKACTRK